MYGNINHEFSVGDNIEKITIKTTEEKILPDGTILPENSIIECQVVQVQRERRWHKSGYILCKLISYTTEENLSPVDLSDKNIYLAVRKYENISGKDAATLTAEIIITQAAGIVGSCFIFFAPVDIAYFFTKGAIRREKHHNWFKAGVYDAYDNSICWFWLKGKPIELQEEESVKIQNISEKKAMKLERQIAKRNEKQAIKDEKKAQKQEAKEQKQQEKLAQLKEKNPQKYERKIQKKQQKQEKFEARTAREIARQQEIFANREARAKARLERKNAKKQLKEEKKALKKQQKSTAI